MPGFCDEVVETNDGRGRARLKNTFSLSFLLKITNALCTRRYIRAIIYIRDLPSLTIFNLYLCCSCWCQRYPSSYYRACVCVCENGYDDVDNIFFPPSCFTPFGLCVLQSTFLHCVHCENFIIQDVRNRVMENCA